MKPVVSKTPSLITSGRTYDLVEDESVELYDDLLMGSSFGLKHVQTGDLLYPSGGCRIYFNGDSVSMRNPKSYSIDYAKIPLSDVYSKIEDRLKENNELARFGMNCSDYECINRRLNSIKNSYHKESEEIKK